MGFGDASAVAVCVVLYVVWTDEAGVHHPRVLTGKCRVAPLLGSTIPRGELQAIVILHRLIATIIDAFPFQFASISTYSDSLCSIGAMYKSSSTLRPYFANRVLEVLRWREQIQLKTAELAPISHVPGEQNPADLGTRGAVGIGELGLDSTWQQGPDFLRRDYDDWPRTSPAVASRMEVPMEEARVLFGASSHPMDKSRANPITFLMTEAASESKLGTVLAKMSEHVLSREKLEMITRTFARVLRAVISGRRDDCRQNPTVKMTEVAVQVLLRVASKSAVVALQQGKLRGLGAENRGNIVRVSGRIRGEQLAGLLGSPALPVILPSEPIAKVILHKAHREDHRRGPRDAVARARRAVWIVSSTRLAKYVIARFHSCKYRDRRMEEQQMGALPTERLKIVAPFEAAALDLFGPFWVKDAAQGRRRFKCWIIAYVCMGSKAVCLLPCPGYSTQVFMTTHRLFCAIYGRPKILYTDHAPSLIKASETPNWEEISSRVGDQGTDWRLTAKGCSWRNGLAERVICSARHTLSHELKLGETLDFHQFGAVVAVVGSILNSRPLSIRVSLEGEYHAIAPRDVLFGRAGRALDAVARDLEFTLDVDQDVAVRSMCDDQAKIVQAWRQKWLEAVFPEMVSRTKWQSKRRNLQVGDIGHIRYTRKVGEPDWRLAMVEVANQDDDGVVCTVTVAFRPRHKSDTGKPYIPKSAVRMTIGVQRFAVLLAVEEMSSSLEASVDAASEMTEN